MTYQTTPPPAPRKRRTGLIITVAVVVAVLAFCGIGAALFNAFSDGVNDAVEKSAPKVAAPAATGSGEPVAEATEDSREATTTMGQPLTQSGDTEATWTVAKPEQKKLAQYDQKPAKGTFLLVYVKVDVKTGTQYVCGCSFQFVDAKGKVYEADYNSFKGREDLGGHEVAAGQHADGWVAFDVPKAALKGGKIKLALNEYTGAYGYWTL